MKPSPAGISGRFGGQNSPGIVNRLAGLFDELERIAAELPPERLPDLFGGLERARWVAEAHFRRAEKPTEGAGVIPRLLAVKEVADLLGVTKQTVYRWATGRLMQAVVRVGDGSIRFDPDKIQKFINARRM